jgi:hypothetical protein
VDRIIGASMARWVQAGVRAAVSSAFATRSRPS